MGWGALNVAPGACFSISGAVLGLGRGNVRGQRRLTLLDVSVFPSVVRVLGVASASLCVVECSQWCLVSCCACKGRVVRNDLQSHLGDTAEFNF